MSRNKAKNRPQSHRRSLRAAAAALAIASALPLMGSALIDPASIQSGETEYETAQAQYGSIVREMTESAAIYQPTYVDVLCKVQDARVAEISITRADIIEKGAKLGVLRSESSRATLAEITLSLSRAKENYADGIRDREEAISEKQMALQTISDATEREIARLEIQKMQLELEDYRLRQEKTIADLAEAEAEQTEKLQDVEVYAPVTGSVAYFSYVNAGDSIGYNEVLLTLQTDDPTLIRIEDPEGQWRYGMAVDITYGPRNNSKSCKARIISADNVLGATEGRGYAFAQLLEEVPLEEMTLLSAVGEQFRLDNVLIIPNNAHVLSEGKRLASILNGASVANRYVSIGLEDKDNSWVLQGLEEGQSLIID